MHATTKCQAACMRLHASVRCFSLLRARMLSTEQTSSRLLPHGSPLLGDEYGWASGLVGGVARRRQPRRLRRGHFFQLCGRIELTLDVERRVYQPCLEPHGSYRRRPRCRCRRISPDSSFYFSFPYLVV